ncbi:MAG: hypothetical protein ACXWLB_05440 [Reyranella sp.]
MDSPLRWLRARAATWTSNKSDGLDAPPATPRAGGAVVSLSIVAIVAFSLWYLVQPLLVLGEADGTRIDIAVRLDPLAATEDLQPGMTVWLRG